MRSLSAWYASVGTETGVLKAARSRLDHAGIDLTPVEQATDEPVGILFFQDYSDELPQRVQELHRSRTARLLVVYLGAGNLPAAESWQLLEAGAADVLSWLSPRRQAQTLWERLDRWSQVDAILSSRLVRDQIVGDSDRWQAVLREAVELSCFSTAPVLVLGATGTGKELIARLIHTLDPRRPKSQLVLVDCTTVVQELSGSEFFGHERGAFTGALERREGAIASADGGTLFLDEVGELPQKLQPELLRAIQEGTYKCVGGNSWRTSRFRLVSATNLDLATKAGRTSFRSDLFYRIAGSIVRLPDLSERREDILPLVRFFLRQTLGVEESPELDPAVEDWFCARNYPGNVRDLKQLVSRIAFRHVGPGPLSIGDLPEDEIPAASRAHRDWPGSEFRSAVRAAMARGVGLKKLTSLVADTAVDVALKSEGGSVKAAADRLHITPRALQMRRAARRSDADH